jgi:hypothetical protein
MLTTPTVPPSILRALRAGLNDFISPRDPLWRAFLTRPAAIEKFTLDLTEFIRNEEAINGSTLTSLTSPLVRSIGWRILAIDGDRYGTFDVGSVDNCSPPTITGFSTAPEVLTAIEQFNEIANADENCECSFEPRVLRVNWLRFEALWLHQPEGVDQPETCDETIIPYLGFVKKPLEMNQAKTIPDFLKNVLGFASKRADLLRDRPYRVRRQTLRIGLP